MWLNEMVATTDYNIILARMNRFAEWLYKFTGPNFEIGKEFFKNSVHVGFMDFYLTAIHQPGITQRQADAILNRAHKKFRLWGWQTSPLITCKAEDALEIVLKEYNRGRTTNRLAPLDDFYDRFKVRPIEV